MNFTNPRSGCRLAQIVRGAWPTAWPGVSGTTGLMGGVLVAQPVDPAPDLTLPLHPFFLITPRNNMESRAPEPVGAYPYTRRVGNLLFLSGVGPRQRGQKAIPGVELDEDGRVLRYDFESQCRAVFQNVRYILEEAGAQWDDLVDVTVFLTNMKDDFATYNRLYAEYFATAQPCRTTLEINCLPTPIAIELKCVAALG